MTSRPTLVIFDIDGTLLASAGLHHDLIAKVLAVDGLNVLFQPWSAYRNYTDRGVLDELMLHTRDRSASAEDLDRYDEAYRAALIEHLARNPLHEISGARRLLSELAAMPSVRIGFATGSMRKMAIVKLDLLGIDGESAALVTGSDYLSREEIVAALIEQACGHLGDAFDAVILGDGIWDERTAVNLGISFVAVQTGTHVFGTTPVLTIEDFSTLRADDLVACARPLRRKAIATILERRQTA